MYKLIITLLITAFSIASQAQEFVFKRDLKKSEQQPFAAFISGGAGSFAPPIAPSWVDDTDECAGVSPTASSPDFYYLRAQTSIYNKGDSPEIPSGYHWASFSEFVQVNLGNKSQPYAGCGEVGQSYLADSPYPQENVLLSDTNAEGDPLYALVMYGVEDAILYVPNSPDYSNGVLSGYFGILVVRD